MAKRFHKKRVNKKTAVWMSGAKGGARWIVHPDFRPHARYFQIDWVAFENCEAASASSIHENKCVAVTVRIPAWQNGYIDDLVAKAKLQIPAGRTSKSLMVTYAIDLLAAAYS